MNCNLPINGLSLGSISVQILRELYGRKIETTVFPIGQSDLSSQKLTPEFVQWLNTGIEKSYGFHSRDIPTFKLWHLQNSLESFSKEQVLLTFYELDSPTREELNIAKNQKKVLVTNQYTANIFKDNGLKNIEVIPLAFDADNFRVLNKKFHEDGRIVFNLTGKLEKRKGHEKVIKAWVKKFGKNPKYFLNCAIYNPFLRQQQSNQIVDNNINMINQIMGGQRIFNVEFLGYMPQNEVYNDYLNSGDIVIDCGTEGFSLPSFHSVALGKHAVVLNCAGIKEWANEENAVLINPSGKIECYDNIFFHKGQRFNQGRIFDFDEDEFIAGCETAIKKVESNHINTKGLELQQKFTTKNMVDKIFQNI